MGGAHRRSVALDSEGLEAHIADDGSYYVMYKLTTKWHGVVDSLSWIQTCDSWTTA